MLRKMCTLTITPVMAIFLIGCSGNELSRDEAAKLISASGAYPKAKTCSLKILSTAWKNNWTAENERQYKTLLEFQSDGWVKKVSKGTLNHGRQWTISWFWTEKMKPYVGSLTEEKPRRFFCAQSQFAGVSGIAYLSDDKSIAKVEYETSREELPSIVLLKLDTRLGSKMRKWLQDKPNSESVLFQRYDDGWRIKN